MAMGDFEIVYYNTDCHGYLQLYDNGEPKRFATRADADAFITAASLERRELFNVRGARLFHYHAACLAERVGTH